MRVGVILALCLILLGCGSQDTNYYQTHPKVLQAAVNACPQKSPRGLSCEQLVQLAEHMNDLADELRRSPQGFGTQILSLQEEIAKQEVALLSSPHDLVLQKNLDQNKQRLKDRLATVKWLESPAG